MCSQVTPCGLVYGRFGGTCFLQRQIVMFRTTVPDYMASH